eukprot:12420685-Karenia_brevis.AAC.1
MLHATDIYDSMDTQHRREVFLSSGGPQCGKVWSEMLAHANQFMDNDHFKTSALLRLGALEPSNGAVCQMPKQGDGEK